MRMMMMMMINASGVYENIIQHNGTKDITKHSKKTLKTERKYNNYNLVKTRSAWQNQT